MVIAVIQSNRVDRPQSNSIDRLVVLGIPSHGVSIVRLVFRRG